jgi:hypothetical protein
VKKYRFITGGEKTLPVYTVILPRPPINKGKPEIFETPPHDNRVVKHDPHGAESDKPAYPPVLGPDQTLDSFYDAGTSLPPHGKLYYHNGKRPGKKKNEKGDEKSSTFVLGSDPRKTPNVAGSNSNPQRCHDHIGMKKTLSVSSLSDKVRQSLRL